MNVTLLIGIGLGGLAALLDIIGTAIPNWWLIEGVKWGLFRYCFEDFDSTTCVAIGSSLSNDWWRATQAMVIMSIIAMCAGVGLAILFGFSMEDKQILAHRAAFMTFSGAGLAIIGVITFGSKSNEAGMNGYLHAGFGLVIVAAILAVPAAVMMLLSKNRKNGYVYSSIAEHFNGYVYSSIAEHFNGYVYSSIAEHFLDDF